MPMHKPFLYSLSALILLTVAAKADMNDLILDKTKETAQKLGLSKDFLAALSTCSSKKEIRNEMGMDIIYEIKGQDDQGNCIMENSSEMQGFKAISSCKFDKEHLNKFISAQKEIRNLIEKASGLEEILSDPKYMEASMMMFDEEICQNKHTEVDQTKELREHLETCRAYKITMDALDRGSTTMEIVGTENKKCRFIYKILTKAPSEKDLKKILSEEMYKTIKKDMKDRETIIDCKFTNISKNKYLNMLKQTVIPAGDLLDIDTIQEKGTAQKNTLKYLENNPECNITQK